jgi:hypothetical protein
MSEKPLFSRAFAMPSRDTFSIAPIREFVQRYVRQNLGCSIDPFARNCDFCTFTNDLNPATDAAFHQDAEEFCRGLAPLAATLALFDPPYSPRQISECYRGLGRGVTGADTQNAALYRRVRDALDALISPGGIVLSFGWSSNGMGSGRGYEIEEILMVAHGGAHNDTICIAERKRSSHE